jgi:hypothetical protein
LRIAAHIGLFEEGGSVEPQKLPRPIEFRYGKSPYQLLSGAWPKRDYLNYLIRRIIMYRNLICLFTFILVLSTAGNISAELVGYWTFDEGSGNVAADSSGYGNDGTINGTPKWVAGQIGGALDFDGSTNYVEIPHDASLSVTDEITIAAWTNMRSNASGEMAIVSKGGWAANNLPYELTETAGDVIFWQFYDNEGRDSCSPESPAVNEWHHIVGTYDGTIFKCYIDGELGEEWEYTGKMPENTLSVMIGRRVTGGCQFNGLIDEVMIYNHALTEDEISQIMMGIGGFGQASRPDPADGVYYPATWVTLSWRAGDFAVSHDVYMGDNYDDVLNGSGDTFRVNQGTTFYVAGFPGYAFPDGLVPGTTYYWRIDEVNQADPNSPWKGEVWSFTVPPKTAYNPNPIDGAEFVETDATFSWTAGFGAKLHTVYLGDSFDDVNNAAGGTAQGPATYKPGTLESEKVYYWRVDEFDGFATFKGDVWSFTTPGAVGNPKPSNGAVDVKMTATLSWTPAVSASSHQVYFGTDREAVRNADTSSPEYKGGKALGSESFDPGKLAWQTRYYWRVDELDSQNNVSDGPLWSFTTADFILVDDFEDYNTGENQIWYAWHDGLGYGTATNPPYFAGNGTGSAVGDETTPSYTEETIVHNGNKSMPVSYDNNKQGFSKYSEVEMTLVYPRDWTEQNVGSLTIWFRGSPSNDAERIYVALYNRTGAPVVIYYDDPAATQIGAWTEWVIALQTFADQGIDLTDVDRIAIGIGIQGNTSTAGGAGKMFFDDIRLYRSSEAVE